MTSKLCVIVLALVGASLAQLNAETPKPSSSAKTGTCASPEPTPEDCSKSGICSLPVASPEELLDSLDVALKPLGNRYGFPADVIAASYGIQDPGGKFAWKLWRFRFAPIQKTFETLRRYGKSSPELPIFVWLNMPQPIGPRLFDAALVRSLLGTELFPRHLRVIEESDISYVLLERDVAKKMKETLKDRHGPCVPNTKPGLLLGRLPPQLRAIAYQAVKAADPINLQNQLLAAPATLPAIPFYTPRAIQMKIDHDGWACQEFSTLHYERINPAERRILADELGDKKGCLLELSIDFPAGTDGAYEQVRIAGTVGELDQNGEPNAKISNLHCAPLMFWKDEKGVQGLRCDNGVIDWTFSQERLHPGGYAYVLVATDYTDKGKAPLTLGLSGLRKGSSYPATACWCSGNNCKGEQMIACNKAARK